MKIIKVVCVKHLIDKGSMGKLGHTWKSYNKYTKREIRNGYRIGIKYYVVYFGCVYNTIKT